MASMTVIAKVSPGKRGEFLQAVETLHNEGEAQRGLTKFTMYQELQDQSGFCLMYEWKSQEVLDRYMEAENFHVLVGALKTLCERSEIRYSAREK